MNKSEELKDLVKTKYGEIASNNSCCCGSSSCCSSDAQVYNIMRDDYSSLNGYNPDADLNLGCGLPTKFAQIKKGDTVVDLGSGAGNDCFIARAETGENGKVIGIDFTPSMLQKAKENAKKLGYANIEFKEGDIEDIPLKENTADVVVSNCVLNLVPNKEAVFKEIYRILKPTGHFCISDIVLVGALPEALQKSAEMYAGCISGAIQKEDYLNLIKKNGFKNILIQKEKNILIPEEILKNNLKNLDVLSNSDFGIFSITVYAEKS